MAQFNVAPSPEESGVRRYYQLEGGVLRYIEDMETKDAFGSPIVLRSLLGQMAAPPGADLGALMPWPSNPPDPDMVAPRVINVPSLPIIRTPISFDYRPPDVCPY